MSVSAFFILKWRNFFSVEFASSVSSWPGALRYVESRVDQRSVLLLIYERAFCSKHSSHVNGDDYNINCNSQLTHPHRCLVSVADTPGFVVCQVFIGLLCIMDALLNSIELYF